VESSNSGNIGSNGSENRQKIMYVQITRRLAALCASVR
jgi:hypothetical protein